MVDAGRGARLAPEPFACGLVVANRQHRLQSDGALQALVVRLVHHAHSAGAEFSGNRVGPDPRRRVNSRVVAGSGGWRAGLGRRPFEPSVEAAQPSSAHGV